MKSKIVFLALLFCTGPLFGQVSGNWILLHDSGLDTLTGLAADSTLETVNLRRFETGVTGILGGGQVIPRSIKIIDQVADISNGEGVTFIDGMGTLTNPTSFNGFVAARAALFVSPGLADVHTTIDLISDPGSHYRYSLAQDVAAADTDSLTVRRWIYGIY